jgi:hypothetical protein
MNSSKRADLPTNGLCVSQVELVVDRVHDSGRPYLLMIALKKTRFIAGVCTTSVSKHVQCMVISAQALVLLAELV